MASLLARMSRSVSVCIASCSPLATAPLVKKKVEEVLAMNLPIDIIATSHGTIWRDNPAQIVEAYYKWSQNYQEDQVTVIYDTMWEGTEKLANRISREISLMSPDTKVKQYNISKADKNDIMTQVFKSKAIAVGSPTVHQGILSSVSGWVDFLKELKFKGKKAAVFGCYGWSGEGNTVLRKLLTEPIVPDHASGELELADGIEQLTRTERRRGMRVVVSDFLTPGDSELDPNVPPPWERSLRRLAVRNQVLAVEVVDRHEIEFPDVGEMLIRDPETDFSRYVNTSDDGARRRMDAATTAQRERIKIALRRSGAGHIQLRTDRDWVADIARFVLNYRRVASFLHQPPQGVSK